MIRAAVRLYRVVLRVYPREFRDAYGDAMVQTFVDRHRYEHASVWLTLGREIFDAATVAPTMRWEQSMNRVVGVAAGVLAVAVIAAVIGGGGLMLLAPLVAVAAVGVIVAGSRNRLHVPIDQARRVGAWAAAGVLAIVIGVAIPAIDGGELNAFWWTVMAACLLSGIGLLLMGLLLVVARDTPRHEPA